jgi:hypothetical protein
LFIQSLMLNAAAALIVLRHPHGCP